MRPAALTTIFASFTFVSLLSSPISAILVAPDSGCSVKCGNVLQSTSTDDIACGDYIYDQQPGVTMKSCIECEMGSEYISSGGVSDLMAALYNVRITAGYCIFNHTAVANTPCITEFACGPFQEAFEYNDGAVPNGSENGYEYCDIWDEERLFKCQNCLGQIGGSHTLFNYITLLDLTCKQRPAKGGSLTIEGSPFDGSPIKAIDPLASASAVASTFHPPTGISLAAKVGIAISGLIVVLVVLGCFVVCRGRRRRRRQLQDYAEKRHKYTGDNPQSKEAMMMKWQEAGYFNKGFDGKDDSPQSVTSTAGFGKGKNRWAGNESSSNSPQTSSGNLGPLRAPNSPYLSQYTTPQASSSRVFSPYISQTVSPVSPGLPSQLAQPPTDGQWGAVPIPPPYRRGSVGTMTGRVEEGDNIEMSRMSQDGRVQEEDRWRREAGQVGFIPAPPPVIRAPSISRGQGHARAVSVESIGQAV